MQRLTRLWPPFVLLASAGCVQAPPATSTEPFTFESGRTPYSIAICIARNAKRLPGITAEERLLGVSGWEVVVREAAGSDALAVAEAANRGSGSALSLRVIQAPDRNPRAFAERLIADCQAQPSAR
ncbi:MAG TPA: hypothetical protein VFZ14_07285 [Burkholderiales bacterium]|nr:hypothetical protein [Burkholderiales bacterium]